MGPTPPPIFLLRCIIRGSDNVAVLAHGAAMPFGRLVVFPVSVDSGTRYRTSLVQRCRLMHSPGSNMSVGGMLVP